MKNQQKILAQAAARKEEFEARQAKLASAKIRNSRDNRFAIIATGLVLLVALGVQAIFASSNSSPSSSATPSATETSSPLVPDPSLAEARTWSGNLTLNGENLAVELDGANAPQTTANFLSLARSGFYKDLKCHRLTNGGFFVLQCGDPNGDGTGGPGYSWGPIENAPSDDVYPKGTIAMARQSGNAASQGSQFFIVYEDTQIPSDSAGGYSVFGKITSGLEKLKPVFDAGTKNGETDGEPKVETKLGPIVLN